MSRRPRDDAASTGRGAARPAIGILILVAVTVVVGAALGTFVLSTDSGEAADVPEPTFTYTFSDGGDGFGDANDRIRITYVEGRPLDAHSIRVVVDGEDVDGVAGNWSAEIGPGESIVITDDATDTSHASVSAIQSGDGILIIWEGPDEDVVISSVEVP